MTEPAGPISFSLLAAFVSLLGPVLGPYALIVFAACVGAALAMSAEPMATRRAGVRFVLLGSGIALLITGPLVWACQTYLAIPGNIALVPVAFALGAARSQLLSIIKVVLDFVAAAVGTALNVIAARRGGGQ